MKITKTLLLGAVVAAALSGNETLRAADFTPSDLSNKAVASSPRAREQFPWLAWQGWPQTASSPRAEGVPASIKQNLAFASSPRMREQFPELARAGSQTTVAARQTSGGESQLAAVLKNRALARSPRMLEKFPELKLRYLDGSTSPAFEIAPLK